MIDLAPDINVQPAEYQRLLGYPPGHEMQERAAELADEARSWYAANGRPWMWARQAGSFELSADKVRIDGHEFAAKRLRHVLQQAEADGAILVAVGAGPEVEAEAQRLWQESKPDEYFFLEMYGSAVVEHLTTIAGARLCAWADGQQMAVLPHDSPGYPGWDISEQPRLLEQMSPLPSALEALDSGALRPKKSLLAVFGLTHHTDRVRRLTDLNPCESCAFTPCQFRRAAYRRGVAETPSFALPGAKYSINSKALKKWAGERLTLDRRADGSVDALFRYEGTTCSNMGRALTFHYHVALGPQSEGWPIRVQQCAPAPGDTGHTCMCAYIDHRDTLMAAIAAEKPLDGQPLDRVLSWERPVSPATCYCDADSRLHKWGLVLETIHYALKNSQ